MEWETTILGTDGLLNPGDKMPHLMPQAGDTVSGLCVYA